MAKTTKARKKTSTSSAKGRKPVAKKTAGKKKTAKKRSTTSHAIAA